MRCSDTNWMVSDKGSRHLPLGLVDLQVPLIQDSYTVLLLRSHILHRDLPARLHITTMHLRRHLLLNSSNYPQINRPNHDLLLHRICIHHPHLAGRSRHPRKTGPQVQVVSPIAMGPRRMNWFVRDLLTCIDKRRRLIWHCFVFLRNMEVGWLESLRRCPMLDVLGCLCSHSLCIECPT